VTAIPIRFRLGVWRRRETPTQTYPSGVIRLYGRDAYAKGKSPVCGHTLGNDEPNYTVRAAAKRSEVIPNVAPCPEYLYTKKTP